MDKVVNYRVFGRDRSPTIYYLLGNGGRIRLYMPHIRALTLFGYRIMAFEYDPQVLAAGQPGRLIQVADEITSAIKSDMKGRQVAGLYGVSLGSLLAINMMARLGIKKTILNTGPGSIVSVIWEVPAFEATKQRYIKNGHDRGAVEKLWKHLEAADNADHLTGSQMLCLNSVDDKIITYANVKATIGQLRKTVEIQETTIKELGHMRAIIRNMFRLRTTIGFFRKRIR